MAQHKNHHHLSSIALQLFDYLVLVVELFLSSKRKQFENRGRHGGTHDSSSNSGNSNKEGQQLKEALAFFDNLSLDEGHEDEARESVKKQFRKKSLVHHPDRNDNSQESVEMMQIINNHYTVINDELDRRQGIVHPDEEEEEEDTPTPTKAPPAEESKQQQTPKSNKKSKKNNKANKRKRTKKNAKKAAARARRQQDEEWNAAERLFRQQQNMLRREKKKCQAKAHRQAQQNELDTPQGRQRAHDAWWQAQVQAQQATKEAEETEEVPLAEASNGGSSSADSSMHDIDDDDDVDQVATATATAPQVDVNNPSTSSNNDKDKDRNNKKKKSSTKPKNLVMECCMDETVVALRMGLSEAAMVSLMDKQHTFIQDYIWKHRHEASSSVVVRDAGRAFLTVHTLDDDLNSYLHYAVYYQNADLVDMIYSHACQFNALPETFFQENAHGVIPQDYYYRCVGGDGTDNTDSNDSFGRKIHTLTDLARDAKPGWSKTMRRLKMVFENIDMVSILNVVACFLVGQIVFGTSALVSLMITTFDFVVVDLVASEDGGSASNTTTSLAEYLFTQHVIWYMLRGLYHLIIPASWGYFSRLAVACCIIVPSIIFPVVGNVLSVIGIGTLLIVATLFKTTRRCIIAKMIAVPPSAKFYYLETVELLLIFSSGAMALQWLVHSAIASG